MESLATLRTLIARHAMPGVNPTAVPGLRLVRANGPTLPAHNMAEPMFGLDCGGCIYLTLFACIDMTKCHAGVAEVFCCIEDNCPTGSAEGCSEQMCGGEIEAALTCGYFANQDCVDFIGNELGRCFDGLGDEDAGL